MEVRVSWPVFSNNVDTNELSINYADRNGNYYLFTTYAGMNLVCVLYKGSNDATEFIDNYMESSTPILTEGV